MEIFINALEKYKLPLALSLIGVVLILGGMFISKPSQSQFPQESLVKNQKLNVDVSGAVASPGVYQLDEGAIVEDAIELAGGFTEEANIKFISKYLNLAKKLTDGLKIYVPYVGEKDTDLAVSEVAGVQIQIVDINTASQAELEALPGIGPSTANKIINNRPYQNVDDLLNKKIVGKAVFSKIKDQLSI